jgi:hypothetical protein
VQLNLTAGWHNIQLDYAAQPGPNTLELYWQVRGGQPVLIPPSALRYATPGTLGHISAPTPPDAVDCSPVTP